jgi:hypothetical protein
LQRRQIELNKRDSLLKLKDLLQKNKRGSRQKQQPKLKGKDLKQLCKLSLIS